MKKKVIDTVVRRYNTWLPCRLTDDEQRERGSSLAHSKEALEKHGLECALVRKAQKERAELLEGEMSRLALIVREKSEQREVSVEVRLTSKAGMVDEVRTDTGEVIATRKIADKEAQADMLEPPAAYAAADVQQFEG